MTVTEPAEAAGTSEPTIATTEIADRFATGSAPPLADPGAQPLPEVAPEPGPDGAVPVPDQYPAPGDLDTGRTRPVPRGVGSHLGLRKFRDYLVIPPTMRIPDGDGGRPGTNGQRAGDPTAVRVEARQARVRFHRDLPTTTAWTYEGSMPGPTIEARRGSPARIEWVNGLAYQGESEHLPYDVVRVPPPPRDGAAEGAIVADGRAALTPGGRAESLGAGADSYPPLPNTAELTAATVVHLHGALTDGQNDGWAHNVAAPGHSTRCVYPNDQEAATLWYHDHAMGVTRFNVPAGLAGFYLIRDDNEDRLKLPSGRHELPLMIADRNFETGTAISVTGAPDFTGRLLYKQAGFTTSVNPPTEDGKYPEGELPVSGPFTIVNGTVWPTMPVEPRWYRLRILNACSSRRLVLALHDTTDESDEAGTPIRPGEPGYSANRRPVMVAIGTDGGFLPAPVGPLDTLAIAPAERLDVLVNFAEFRGRTLELRNELAVIDALPGDADASIMQFTVSSRPSPDRWRPPAVLNPDYDRYVHLPNGDLQVGDRIIPTHEHYWIGLIPAQVRSRSAHPELWELQPVDPDDPDQPTEDVIEVTESDGSVVRLHAVSKLFDDLNTIIISRGAWAVWHILHLGGPAHPLHIHMTQFQMLRRRTMDLGTPENPAFDLATGSTPKPIPIRAEGPVIDPIAAGMKDTWLINPGEWVSVLGEFDGATGSFMYHCHILDHEDHTMMRPFVVLPPDLLAFHGAHGGGHSH